MDAKVKAQLEALYGPCAKADYQIGDTIHFRTGSGEILWIAGPGDTPVTGKHHGVLYVVDTGGFPELVAPGDLVQA